MRRENITKTNSTTIVTAIFASALLATGAAGAYTGEQYASKARITMGDATRIAKRAQSGQITDQELEYESGGSGLRYSFDIKSGKVTHEVGVDAQTGKVLENSVQGKNPD